MTNRLDEIEELIEKSFRDPEFCVKTLCTELGIGMSSLHELVSVKYRTTPHLLIETKRLTEALSLMKENHSCLGAIVGGCGFSSIRTFRRVFERRIGTTPSEAMGNFRNVSDRDRFHRACVNKLLKAIDPIQDSLQSVRRNVRKNDRKV